MYLSKTYLKGDDTLRPVTVGVQTTSSWLPTYRWAHWGHCASIFGNWFLSQPAEPPQVRVWLFMYGFHAWHTVQLYLVDGTEEKFTPQKQQRMSPSTESHTISPWNLAEDMSDESSRYKIILNDLSPIFSVERLRRVKHLQFSFDGKWLVICTIYNCSVYQFGVSFCVGVHMEAYLYYRNQGHNIVRIWVIHHMQDKLSGHRMVNTYWLETGTLLSCFGLAKMYDLVVLWRGLSIYLNHLIPVFLPCEDFQI